MTNDTLILKIVDSFIRALEHVRHDVINAVDPANAVDNNGRVPDAPPAPVSVSVPVQRELPVSKPKRTHQPMIAIDPTDPPHRVELMLLLSRPRQRRGDDPDNVPAERWVATVWDATHGLPMTNSGGYYRSPKSSAGHPHDRTLAGLQRWVMHRHPSNVSYDVMIRDPETGLAYTATFGLQDLRETANRSRTQPVTT